MGGRFYRHYLFSKHLHVHGVSLDGALGKKTTLMLETIFKEEIGVKLIVTARHTDPKL